jgi:RpiR family transcriptional regulator, carbohydrate utilization regulator
MSSSTTSVLHTLRARLEALPSGERRVGELVLSAPQSILAMTTADLAAAGGVSDPTVVRFARSLGLGGVSDLKLHLAADLARSSGGAGSPSPGDSIGSVVRKLSAMAIASLSALPELVDQAAAEAVADLLSRARYAVIIGFGASAVDAADLGQRLLGVTAAAVESDVHRMLQRVQLCKPDDVLVVFSHSGRSVDLMDVIALAESAAVPCVAFAPPGSLIANAAKHSIGLDLPDDTDLANPSLVHITTALLIEAVVTAIELRDPDAAQERRGLARSALTGRRAEAKQRRRRRL